MIKDKGAIAIGNAFSKLTKLKYLKFLFVVFQFLVFLSSTSPIEIDQPFSPNLPVSTIFGF